MKLQHVINTLDSVIENKQKLLETLQKSAREPRSADSKLVCDVTSNFLNINIQELQNIREHLLEIDDIG